MGNKRYEKYKSKYEEYRKNNKLLIKEINRKYAKSHKKECVLRNDKFLFGRDRTVVLERDNFKCVKCGMTQKQHISLFGRSLSIDHIDGNGRYSKVKNNSLDNLQTLCLRCHTLKDNKSNFVKKGEHRSPKTEFKKGNIPWSKGRSFHRKKKEISG